MPSGAENSVVVQDQDNFWSTLEISADGSCTRRDRGPNDLCHGWGQIQDNGTITAIFDDGDEPVLQHGTLRWSLMGLRIDVTEGSGRRRTATVLRDNDHLADLEYEISAGHDWQRDADPTWDVDMEESNDLFVFLQNSNNADWCSRVSAQWRDGFTLK